MATRRAERPFGTINRLPSGNYRARYADPEGRMVPPSEAAILRYRQKHPDDPEGMPAPEPLRHNAPHTFQARQDANAWLVAEKRLIDSGLWTSPESRRREKLQQAAGMPTFEAYARGWIDGRKNRRGEPLAPRTRDHYLQLLADYLSPTFGALPLDEITPTAVNIWYDAFKPIRKKVHGKKTVGATAKAHTYSLARAIMNTATSAHGPLVGQVNPFAVRGGGSSAGRKRDTTATSSEVAIMLATIRPEWRLIILLGLWMGLRFSEIAELRRSDVFEKERIIKVRRAVSRSKVEGVGVKAPKSEAGIRDQIIPANVLPALREHLRTYVTGRDGLLFPGRDGQHLAPASFYGSVPEGEPTTEVERERRHRAAGWYAARAAAGRTDLHFHDLRATGATLLAQQGGTIADVQAFLGDSTAQAAQRYVRSAEGRQKMLADRMAALDAEGAQW